VAAGGGNAEKVSGPSFAFRGDTRETLCPLREVRPPAAITRFSSWTSHHSIAEFLHQFIDAIEGGAQRTFTFLVEVFVSFACKHGQSVVGAEKEVGHTVEQSLPHGDRFAPQRHFAVFGQRLVDLNGFTQIRTGFRMGGKIE
jgi:hypothetical protein